MLYDVLKQYCKLKNIDVSVCRDKSSLTKSSPNGTNSIHKAIHKQPNDTYTNDIHKDEYIKSVDNECYHTRYIGNKKYYAIKKRVFEIYVSDNNVKVIYGNLIEKLTIEEFEEYLEKQINDIKLGKRWKNTNRPKKKMSYVHNKITEMGIDYIKSKSGVNFNMKI